DLIKCSEQPRCAAVAASVVVHLVHCIGVADRMFGPCAVIGPAASCMAERTDWRTVPEQFVLKFKSNPGTASSPVHLVHPISKLQPREFRSASRELRSPALSQPCVQLCD